MMRLSSEFPCLLGRMRRALIGAALLLSASRPALAAFTYPDCADAVESQFNYVPVVGRSNSIPVSGGAKAPLAVDPTMNEPLHMAFDSRPDGKSDLYWTERGGTVKRFDPAANAVATVGTLAGVSLSGEMGLTGIALDPAFKTNHRIYLFYANSSPSEFRVARFVLDASGKLDAAGQQVLLRIKRSDDPHTGGALAFDGRGDLWITVGKNAPDYPASYNEGTERGSTEATSGNLADMRGGILRIHPDNSARGYSIPDGNFGQYWSEYFNGKGEAALASEYADTLKVRPEIYVKGTRNAYTIAVHPVKRWLAWGEFGVNTSNTFTEEHNLVTRPAFGGYPYFAGGFGTGVGTGYYELWSGAGADRYNAAHPGLTQSASGPVNQSVWNKGPKRLPPVTPALHSYMHGAGAGAVTGPLYVYDPASPSRIKWPPHFDGAWIITDWVQGTGNNGFKGVKIFGLNAAGDAKVDSLKWFQNLGWVNPISMAQGADGAIYIVNYAGSFSSTAGTHIGRLEYAGNCFPATAAAVGPDRAPRLLRWEGRDIRAEAAGPLRVTVRDAAGRLLFSGRRNGPGRLELPEAARRPGVYIATLHSEQGILTLRLARP